MSEAVSKPGRVEEISSTANPRIKSIKALAMKKNRDRESVFLVEGEKLVHDALASGWIIRTLIYARKAHDDERLAPRVEKLATQVRARGGDILIANDKVLTSITRRDNAQAIVAVVQQKLVSLADKITPANEVWLGLDRVRDPGNLGTIIRTADASGVKGIFLVGETTDPFALEAVRATMGSLFHVPLMKINPADFLAIMESVKTAGGQAVGTHLKGAVDHRAIDYSNGPQLLLMGNEQQGLPEDLAKACHQLALIAMDGAADSLNLAVATGIMVFEARRHALG